MSNGTNTGDKSVIRKNGKDCLSGKTDYRLENIIKKQKKLAVMRKEIMALDSEQALDMILGSDIPATLIQSFPEQDLYFLMYRIGADDFLPVLSLASFEQWEYILDMDVWDNDIMNIPNMTRTLRLLFEADSKRLMRWMINEKPEFIEYYLFKNIQVRIREHDEDPSSFEDGYMTIDDVFYVKFPDVPDALPDYLGDRVSPEQLKKDRQASRELITTMLNTVADMDLGVYHALLLESCSVISAEVEENQLRLRNVRLAEKGFSPYYEAVGIYQPLTPDKIRKKPLKYIRSPLYGTNLPLPPHYFVGFLSDKSIFVKSLGFVEEDILLNLENEFAVLVNRLISADKKIIHEKDDFAKITQKACCYLDLGLELIHDEKNGLIPGQGAEIIKKYWLEDIFRIASSAGIMLKKNAERWYENSFLRKNNLPLSFLGEKWFGLVGGLFLDRPMYFDNYGAGTLYREFSCYADIKKTKSELDKLIGFDRIFLLLNPDVKSIVSLDSVDPVNLNYKNVLLTMWVCNRLDMDSSWVSAIPVDRFRPFFKELFAFKDKDNKIKGAGKIDIDKRKDMVLWLLEQPEIKEVDAVQKEKFFMTIYPVLQQFFDEIEDEYGSIDPNELDSRFVAHFLLK